MLQTDRQRLKNHIETIAEYNDTPGNGCTRLTYSEQDRKTREYLTGCMKEAGLKISVDGVGNMFAELQGTDGSKAPILTGSHIDTVFHGGKYDGVVGIVCALEALYTIREAGIQPVRPIQMVIFSEEEGPNFGSPLAGSKAMTGIYTAEHLRKLKNDQGVSMYQAAKDAGYDPDTQAEYIIRPGDIDAMIEVHVEQSIVLDREGISLGIVTGIAGMRWAKLTIRGESNHAGATPMGYRHDAMAGAAEFICTVEKAALDTNSTTVATVGKISCAPNVPNVIPNCVEVYLDIRDVYSTGMQRVLDSVTENADLICRKRGLSYDLEMMGKTEPSQCSARVIHALKAAAVHRNIQSIEMTSGALHDTAVMAGVTDIGMLFVPSIGGRSHVPQEETAIEDIGKAADVLTDTLLSLAEC